MPQNVRQPKASPDALKFKLVTYAWLASHAATTKNADAITKVFNYGPNSSITGTGYRNSFSIPGGEFSRTKAENFRQINGFREEHSVAVPGVE